LTVPGLAEAFHVPGAFAVLLVPAADTHDAVAMASYILSITGLIFMIKTTCGALKREKKG
jgi:hypothetical protein